MRISKTLWLVGAATLMLAGCGEPTPTGASGGAGSAKVNHMKLSANGTVTTDNLVAYASAKMGFEPKDEFSKGFDDSALEGRTFKLRLPVTSDSDGMAIHYRYDAAAEELSINLLTRAAREHRDEDASGPDFEYITIMESEEYGKPTEMANAFGATKEVTPVYGVHVGVGSYGDDDMGTVPRTRYVGYDLSMKHIKMAPDEARATTTGLYAIVEGAVTKATTGGRVECVETKKAATMTYAYEEHWKTCVISAKIKRIQVISPKAGVLATWPMKDDKGPGRFERI